MEQRAALVADTAMLAGTLILENGGETYRAEETALRVCLAGGIVDPEIIAFPTGIFVSGNQGLPDEKHGFMRVHRSSVHLSKLERTNAYCRRYVAGECTVEQLSADLTALRADARTIPFPLRVLLSALITASFAVMLGGGVHGAWMALLCGIALRLVTDGMEKSANSAVSVNMAGGAAIALTAVLLTHLTGRGDLDVIIVSSCMPILPGLATLNAVRDAMCGDLVSGSARLLKALLMGVSLAAGAGLVLAVYVWLGGAV